MRNPRVLKFLLILFVLNAPVSFSQKWNGTYETVRIPRDAPPLPKTPDGATEFPVSLTKSTWELTSHHKLKITHANLDGSNPVVIKGTWTQSGKTAKFEIEQDGEVQTVIFEFVQLKSGNYIKRINDPYCYYKKK